MSVKSDEAMKAVAEKIIKSIEDGIVTGEWHKPWAGGTIALNAVTKNQYKGGNLIALMIFGEDYSDGYWATYKQWESVGAQVRKGETGIRLVKWTPKPCKDHGSDEMCQNCGTMIPNVFTVFNADQVDGWERPGSTVNPEERIAAADRFVTATGAKIRHNGEGRAYYNRQSDEVTLPHYEWFTGAHAYYATAAHELVHWTGHESRLNRAIHKNWGDDTYAGEELVAELGAAMLCATLGLDDEPREDHARYLKAWVGKLRDNYKLLWNAASLAQKAVDHLWTVSAVEEEAA